MGYEMILTETRNHVGIITLNRPDALNALNNKMALEMTHVLDDFEQNSKIGCIIITGSEKAFAAGADVKEMADMNYMDAFMGNYAQAWDRVATCRKPIIAAVAGYALGGGCELAMMCDFIIAADTAKFGQPEISLGIMPGIGGTQRLARFIGKAKAMEMCLTGRLMEAEEAESCGLVARVVPASNLSEDTFKTAEKIANLSIPIAMMAKESINRAFETSLSEGVRFEQRVFHAMFATEDQKEGMAAFIEKRNPQFKNR